MSYDQIKEELNRFKLAGIPVTVGQFARFIQIKSEEVVVKPYRYKALSGRATKQHLKAIA